VSVEAQHLIFKIPPEEAGIRLDRFLAARHGTVSRSRWQSLIESDQVLINDKPVRSGAVLKGGDRVDVRIPPPAPASPLAQDIPLDILHEDEDYILISKPPGMVVHPAAGHGRDTLVNALLHHCGHLSNVGGVMRPGIVHRIDKDTSGVMAATKNDLAHRHLAAQFEAHTIERVYEALVWGTFRLKRGTFRGTIERDPRHRLRMTGKTGAGRHAVTHFEVLGETPHFSYIRCTLETGRTHQIRVHCTEAGHPLIGDQLYGRSRSVSPRMGAELQQRVRNFPRQALNAAVLGFTDRAGETIRCEIPLPADMADLWALMQAEDSA
jgi:23S rRNA pseudouridine1911/1915/1917 synthase